MPIDPSFGLLARSEVDGLHSFFQSWYRGYGSETLERAALALAEEFELISPADECISRNLLLEQLSAERGAYPDLTISIQHMAAHPAGSDAVSLEYIEQHVENGHVDRRACRALLRHHPSVPSSVQWVSIYERRAA
jgi:hypothetical protein